MERPSRLPPSLVKPTWHQHNPKRRYLSKAYAESSGFSIILYPGEEIWRTVPPHPPSPSPPHASHLPPCARSALRLHDGTVCALPDRAARSIRPAGWKRQPCGPMRAVRRRGDGAVQTVASGLRRAGKGAGLRVLHDLPPDWGPGVRSVHGALRYRAELSISPRGEQTSASSAGGTGRVCEGTGQKAKRQSNAWTR